MKQKIGFVGLGEMGKWMSANILKAGYSVIVYDVRPEAANELVAKGAEAAQSLSDMAKKTDCIFLSLPDTEVVQQVLFGKKGLVDGLSRGSVLVDLSTIHYLATLKISEEFTARGIIFIDAPVSGMEARAKDATLTVMAGGNSEAVEKIRPILNVIGNNVVYMGNSGNGQLAKLVNQLSFNVSCAAMAEILPMAVKLGLDPEATCKVITTGSGGTWANNFFTPYILKNNFKPGYTLTKAYKDMMCAAEISSKEKIPMPVVFAAMQTYQMALAEGYGNENKGAMIKVWEKALGVKVRSKGV
jgi:3-hydroxyisobutyrate dehydrogenase-like beta-hydroxyacid dehydrogenase